MALDPQLLAILACPQDKGPLYYLPTDEVLYNPRLARAYRVREGIPVMLIDEADALEASDVERFDALIAADGIAPTFTP